jgi:hypothetical protein
MSNLVAEPVFHPGAGHFVSKSVDQSLFGEPLFQHEHPRWTTPEEGEALLDRDGYLVIPRLFDEQACGTLLNRLVNEGGPDERYDVKGWCFNKNLDLELQTSTRFLWAIDRDPAIEQLDRLLGSDCKIMAGGLWSTGAGRRMPIHVDHRSIQLPEGMAWPEGAPIPCFLAVLIAALEDQDPAMGPTMVVPGSHRRRPRAGDRRQRPVALVLKRGDGLILRGDLCHGAAANTGPRRRNHFHSTWGSAYVESFMPPMKLERYWSPEVLGAVTPRQRRLLGGWTHPNGGREQVWRKGLGLDPATSDYPG